MAAAVAAIQPVPRDDIAVKEMLLEHIRQDAIWKARLEATLRTYGIFLSPESYVGEDDTTAATTTDPNLGPSENLMRNNSSVQPNNQDQQVERSKSCERSDGNGSSRGPPHPGVPSNLVRPILADGTTYAGGSNGQLEVNQDVSNSTVKLSGRSTSVTSEAGTRVVENPRPHRQVAMKRTSQMPMQNIKSSKPAASASKRVATKTDMKRYNYYKDCEEARNHIEEIEDNRGRIFKCKLCGHSGNQEPAVIMHIRMSHIGNDRKFACHLCSYRFKQKTHLNYHLTHTHGQEIPATATSSNDSNFGEMETDTSNDPSPSATSDGALLQDSEMDVEFDLSYAYETFTADDASISYICLTCAEVSKEKAGMVAHILKNHIPGRSQNGNKRETGTPHPTPAQQPAPPEKNDSLPRVAVKRTMPPTHAFTEAEKTAVDQLILNILNPASPYTCKVCHTICQSKQRARLHVLFKHSEDLDLADS